MDWNRAAVYIVLCFFLIAASIEFLSLLHWLLQPLGLYHENMVWIKNTAQLESQIFYYAAPLTPVFFTLFIFSWIAKPLLRILKAKGLRLKIRGRDLSPGLPGRLSSSTRLIDGPKQWF